MIVYPAIDLMSGECVRLYKGNFAQKTTYSKSPDDIAQGFRQEGSQWLHLIDLDGALEPKKRQLKTIQQIIRSSHLNVQTGGGIRSEDDVSQLIKAGASRVIIGSLATKEIDHVKYIIGKYGSEKICLAADVQFQHNDYYVAFSGWQEHSKITLKSLIREYLPAGLKHVLCTDISLDGTLEGCNLELYNTIQKTFSEIDFQASGGVASLDDLWQLKTAGVIVGKALYEGAFSLKEALEVVCSQSA